MTTKFLSVERLVEHHAHLREIPNGPSTSAQLVYWAESQSHDGYRLTDDARIYLLQHEECCRREQMLQAAQ